MNRKILSALLAVTLILLTMLCGCKKSGESSGKEKDSVPLGGEGSALTVTATDVALSDSDIQSYVSTLRDGSKLAKDYAADFQMEEKKVRTFESESENWFGFTLTVKVRNTSGTDLTFFNFICGKNGKDDIYVDTAAHSAFAFAEPGESAMAVKIVAYDKSGNITAEDVLEKLSGMELGLMYTTTEQANADEFDYTALTDSVPVIFN